MQFSNARLLSSDGSGHLNELNLNNSVSSLTRRVKLKKRGKTLDYVSCFPLHFFRALPLPACFTTGHSTVEASLFVNYIH